MYELYKTFKRSLSAILDGLQIEPYTYQLVCCFVSVLEHPPLSGGVLHQPGRSDGNGKIGSKATYHRCLKNLNDWKYIYYMPSHNPYKGSQIKMLKFGTSRGTSSDTGCEPTTAISSEQDVGQALVPNTNINKQIENSNKPKLPKNENEVLGFFKKKRWPSIEGRKFFNHYTSIGWKVGGKIKIVDWQASAENWMLKAAEIKTEKTVKEVSHNRDNLKTTKNKDYGQPL